MSFLNRLFSKNNPNEEMHKLYLAVVAEGRNPAWYEKGGVPDTIDGRFDMIAAILAVAMIKLEATEEHMQKSAWLMELFVDDMDGQLRQMGVGDVVVGKHVKRMMGALGGRLGAYRSALAGDTDLNEAITRNIYRGEKPEDELLQYVATGLRTFHAHVQKSNMENILDGNLPGGVQ